MAGGGFVAGVIGEVGVLEHRLEGPDQGCPWGRQKNGFVTPTGTNAHRHALCFMVKTCARHKTTETVLNKGWWLAVGCWRLVAVGCWQLAVGGPWGLFLRAVLNQKKTRVLQDSPAQRGQTGTVCVPLKLVQNRLLWGNVGKPDVPKLVLNHIFVSEVSDVLQCLWWTQPPGVPSEEQRGASGKQTQRTPFPELQQTAGPGPEGRGGGGYGGDPAPQCVAHPLSRSVRGQWGPGRAPDPTSTRPSPTSAPRPAPWPPQHAPCGPDPAPAA